MPSTSLAPLLWFVAIIALIPVALWLLKRTPLGAGAGGQGLRMVAMLPISPNQRLLTVEVGQGEERRWLVLGVTPTNITTLHTLMPGAEPTAVVNGAAAASPFAQVLGRLRGPGNRQ